MTSLIACFRTSGSDVVHTLPESIIDETLYNLLEMTELWFSTEEEVDVPSEADCFCQQSCLTCDNDGCRYSAI